MDVAVELPAQAKVQRQVRPKTEAVLRVKTESGERIALHSFGELNVLMRLLIHLRGDRDAGNPTGQERIEIESIGDVVPAGVNARQRIS